MRYFIAGVPGVLVGAAVAKVALGVMSFGTAAIFACIAGIVVAWFVHSVEEALCDTQLK